MRTQDKGIVKVRLLATADEPGSGDGRVTPFPARLPNKRGILWKGEKKVMSTTKAAPAQLPHNLEAVRALLGSGLLDNGRPGTIRKTVHKAGSWGNGTCNT